MGLVCSKVGFLLCLTNQICICRVLRLVHFHSLFIPRSVAVGGAAAFVYHKTALCNDAPVLHSGLKIELIQLDYCSKLFVSGLIKESFSKPIH